METKQGNEIVIKVKSDIGVLFEIAKLVSERGMNILAVSGAACGEDCVIRLVTDDNLRTRDILGQRDFATREERVVLVDLPHKPGMLKRVTETLARENIDIHHIYATVAAGYDRCLVVFHSSNDEHALAKLKEMPSDG